MKLFAWFVLVIVGLVGLMLWPAALRATEVEKGANRMESRTFISNQDCDDVMKAAPDGNVQAWIREYFQRVFAAGVGVFIADVAMNVIVCVKDIPSGEMNGFRFPEEQANTFPRYRHLQELIAQGTDVLHLAVEEGHKADALVIGGMRMSDAHHGTKWQAQSNNIMFPKVVMDHPEWCNTWEDGSRDATLNYAIPEVRAHVLAMLHEMAANYDIDGIELNWMRWCRHFPHGHQREYLDVLTDFVRQVREMLDEVAQERGCERLVLGHRVAATVDECLNIGCDVETWAKEGYADFLAPMDFLLTDLCLRTEEFVAATKGTKCLVYPGVQPHYSFSKPYNPPLRIDSSLDKFRAAARNFYSWGANGGSSFNVYLWEPEEQAFYAEAIAILSSTELATAGPRHYIYVPIWKGHGGGVAPTGRHNAQMLTFGANTLGQRQPFTFRMADGRYGKALEGTLRFRIYDATPEDEFAVDLNREQISVDKFNIEYQPEGDTSSLSGEPFWWPAGLCFEIPLADCPPFRGDNELGITLIEKDPAAQNDPIMEALEVYIERIK